MLYRNRWHNFTPGTTMDYRLPASLSYTFHLCETAYRNAFQGRWPGVLEVIWTCCDNCKLLAQKILGAWKISIPEYTKSVLTVIKLFYQPNTPCTNSYNVCLSLWHVWSLTCEQYFHRMKSFSSQSWQRTVFVPLSFPYTDSDWFSGLPFVTCYDSCISIASASLAAFIPSAEVQFGIQSDAICTILAKRIAYTYKWSFGIFDAGQVSWMLYSVHDICESKTWMPNVCPKVHPAFGSLKTMQAPSAYRFGFLSNLLCLRRL